MNFIGNVEARDMLDGVADVIVTDGFTGNVALKTVEGAALSIFKMLRTTLTSSTTAKARRFCTEAEAERNENENGLL